MNAPDDTGPLAGVRIVDLCHFLAGPYATSVMAHLGADVIKVEDPGHPDEARQIGPFLEDGTSLYFAALNSSKRSLGARLDDPPARSVIQRLVSWADVVVSNYRPGVLERLGLAHTDLEAINPKVITCSITAFGESGPYASFPGYDYTIQAITGVMALTGEPDQSPQRAGISYVDHSAGLAAALAVSAALFRRERSGHGAHLDVSLMDVQVSMLSYLAAWELNSDTTTARMADGAHPQLVPAQTFRAADGYMSLFIGNDDMWRRLVAVMGDERLANDDLATNAGRFAHRQDVIEILRESFFRQSVGTWVSLMRKANVACAPVNTLSEALADVQVNQRGVVRSAGQGSGAYRYPAGPLPGLESKANAGRVQKLGASSAEVLIQLGFRPEDISRLLAQGAVVIPD